MPNPCRSSGRTGPANQQCAPPCGSGPSRGRARPHREGGGRRRAAVKVVGAGHSFTGIACTDGHLVDLSATTSVLAHDPPNDTGHACRPGITLASLCDELDARGLALENMGDIGYQSIAGATSTATHGTGTAFGNLSSRIVGLRLVTADGSVVDCSADENADVFDVARVGLGALGRRCRRSRSNACPRSGCTRSRSRCRSTTCSPTSTASWTPPTTSSSTGCPTRVGRSPSATRRTDEPIAAAGRRKEFVDDILVPNAAFGGDVPARPPLAPRHPATRQGMPSTSSMVEYTDRSDKVFTSPRLVHFYEMEYAIPREAIPEALNRVRALVDRLGRARSASPSRSASSPPTTSRCRRPTGGRRATSRCTCTRHTPYDQYFQGVEAIMNDYGGRPHWGKLHFQSAATLAPRYPRWDAFQAVRAQARPRSAVHQPVPRPRAR